MQWIHLVKILRHFFLEVLLLHSVLLEFFPTFFWILTLLILASLSHIVIFVASIISRMKKSRQYEIYWGFLVLFYSFIIIFLEIYLYMHKIKLSGKDKEHFVFCVAAYVEYLLWVPLSPQRTQKLVLYAKYLQMLFVMMYRHAKSRHKVKSSISLGFLGSETDWIFTFTPIWIRKNQKGRKWTHWRTRWVVCNCHFEQYW